MRKDEANKEQNVTFTHQHPKSKSAYLRIFWHYSKCGTNSDH